MLVFFFFFYLGFFSRTFTNYRTAEQGEDFFNSSLPLSPVSKTIGHLPDDYCRELTTANCRQLDSKKEYLVPKRKSLKENT